jgi:hypothetical protein
MARRSRVLVLLCVIGCGGAASTAAAPSGTTTAAPTVAPPETNEAPVAIASSGPSAGASTPPLATKGPHAPTFALPKPLPPVNAVLNLGSNPPTPEMLEAIFSAAKQQGTAAHAAAGRRLAELCRRYELSEGAVANDAIAKVAAKPSDATSKAKFLAARKRYELMRHCVIDAYRKVADGDPGYAQGDEVLAALAAEYDDRRVFVADEDGPLVLDDRTKALAASLELVKNYPLSRHVVAAYRRFGDHYFDEAMRGKMDWKIPEEAYRRLRDLSDATKQIENAYAHYRLGYVAWNQGDSKEARKSLHAAVDVTTKYSMLPFANDVLAAANDALATLP